jgi:hypothetical protein
MTDMWEKKYKRKRNFYPSPKYHYNAERKKDDIGEDDE